VSFGYQKDEHFEESNGGYMLSIKRNFRMLAFAIELIAVANCFSLHAQTDSGVIVRESSPSRDWKFSPGFRGIQGELVWVLFSHSYGGSIDIDLLRDASTNKAGIGIRLGIENIEKGDFGGKVTGSPFLHYNVLARVTFPMGDLWRVDFYGGATRHIPAVSDLPQIYSSLFPTTVFKIGMDIRWRLGGELFGVLLKGNYTREIGSGGIGLYAGWSE
jgi:hypothetical protein